MTVPPAEMLWQAAIFHFQRFPLRIPVWVGFGEFGLCAEFLIVISSDIAVKSGLNMNISTGFGRSVGIRTRGLLVPNQARYQTSPHPVGSSIIGDLRQFVKSFA